ncbi:C3HC zinc finger-like-domain-containing protein [Calycina marina]|uniref:C3HC zinc finger-like-domain-containing protein n=1 Tax=Calycina marina TaxID=1763456 RepID=A0A9P8CDK8_9HELO|nr:C3HC zinc finger-like-domain-containing protein [Calycina marina]
MNATKRNFNALLNGIGNKSSNSLAKGNELLPPPETSSLKKRRIIPSKTSQVAAAYAANSGHKKLASTTTSPNTARYAPWDRVAFLKRLKSFSNLTDWTAKPAQVNEVEWAKRGWVCQKAERVRCCLCNVEILVKLNRKEVDGLEEPVYIAKNIEDSLVEKYAELIINSHAEDCLWRKRGCDDSIFKLPLNNTPLALEGLQSRYKELCLRKDTLPYTFNLQLPTDFDLNQQLSFIPADFLGADEFNKVAFQMALFGWEGHKHERLGNQLTSVSCQACYRVLGLWLFKSAEVNEAGEETERAKLNSLDVVFEHRAYCPWRNSESQNGATTKSGTALLPGWKIMLRVMKNDHHLRYSGERPVTAKPKPMVVNGDLANPVGEDEENADAKSIREDKEKERWARLKRVKSLFDVKGGKKLGTASANR